MNTKGNTSNVWFNAPIHEIIEQLNIPYMTSEFIAELCLRDPQKVTDALLAIARKGIGSHGAAVALISGSCPSAKTELVVECIMSLGGKPEELKKVIGFEKLFEMIENPLDYEEPALYERIRQGAFNLMRKMEIKSFSEDELWRVFKHSRHSGLYLSLVRKEIKDGFTITSLYEQDHDRGLDR
jgi:hypothetical protein